MVEEAIDFLLFLHFGQFGQNAQLYRFRSDFELKVVEPC